MKCPKCEESNTKQIQDPSKMSWNTMFAIFTWLFGIFLIVMSFLGWASAIIAISVTAIGYGWMKFAEKKDVKDHGQKWYCNDCKYSFKVNN